MLAPLRVPIRGLLGPPEEDEPLCAMPFASFSRPLQPSEIALGTRPWSNVRHTQIPVASLVSYLSTSRPVALPGKSPQAHMAKEGMPSSLSKNCLQRVELPPLESTYSILKFTQLSNNTARPGNSWKNDFLLPPSQKGDEVILQSWNICLKRPEWASKTRLTMQPKKCWSLSPKFESMTPNT